MLPATKSQIRLHSIRGNNLSEDAKEELRDFIEELTDIARTAQSVSIISGYHLAWWGGVVTLACLLSLASLQQHLPLSEIYIWPATMVMGWIGSYLLRRKFLSARQSGLASEANRISRSVWISIGIAAAIVTIGEAISIFEFGGRAYFIVFLLCALGLIMTAAAVNEPLLFLSGAGWFLVGIGSLFFVPTAPVLYAATIVACLVFLILPGLVMGVRRD